MGYERLLEVLRCSLTLLGCFEVVGGALIDSELFLSVHKRSVAFSDVRGEFEPSRWFLKDLVLEILKLCLTFMGMF